MEKFFVSKRILFFKSQNTGWLLYFGNSNSFYRIPDENVSYIAELIKTGNYHNLSIDIINELKKFSIDICKK